MHVEQTLKSGHNTSQGVSQNAKNRFEISLIMERPQFSDLILDTDHCRLSHWKFTASGNGI
jgi:hypothetical protein